MVAHCFKTLVDLAALARFDLVESHLHVVVNARLGMPLKAAKAWVCIKQHLMALRRVTHQVEATAGRGGVDVYYASRGVVRLVPMNARFAGIGKVYLQPAQKLLKEIDVLVFQRACMTDSRVKSLPQ